MYRQRLGFTDESNDSSEGRDENDGTDCRATSYFRGNPDSGQKGLHLRAKRGRGLLTWASRFSRANRGTHLAFNTVKRVIRQNIYTAQVG